MVSLVVTFLWDFQGFGGVKKESPYALLLMNWEHFISYFLKHYFSQNYFFSL